MPSESLWNTARSGSVGFGFDSATMKAHPEWFESPGTGTRKAVTPHTETYGPSAVSLSSYVLPAAVALGLGYAVYRWVL